MNITNVKIESLPHSRVRLSLVVPETEVQLQYRATLNRYMRTAKVKGFRAGKVPEGVILSRFADDLQHDALEDAVSTAVQQALENDDSYEPLRYDPPRLTNKPDYSPQKSLPIEVEFDVLPRLELPSYEHIEVAVPDATVDAAAIQREIDRLQQSRAVYHPRGNSDAVDDGDAVVVDVVDAAGTRRSDVRFVIGDQNAPAFAPQLVGTRIGQQKIVSDPQSGADASDTITVTVTGAQRRELPAVDDHFASAVHKRFTTLADLKEAIQSELGLHHQRRLERVKKERVVQYIADRVDIDIPLSMIEVEKQDMWQHLLNQYKMTEEQLVSVLEGEGRSQEDLFRDWHADTIRRATGALVLRALQEREEIKVENSDIDAFVATRAAQSGHEPHTLKQMYIDNKKMGDVIHECAEDLLFARLFQKTTFTVDKALSID